MPVVLDRRSFVVRDLLAFIQDVDDEVVGVVHYAHRVLRDGVAVRVRVEVGLDRGLGVEDGAVGALLDAVDDIDDEDSGNHDGKDDECLEHAYCRCLTEHGCSSVRGGWMCMVCRGSKFGREKSSTTKNLVYYTNLHEICQLIYRGD